VAEGAETSAEVGALLAMGSDFVQGYYYYHPMNVSEIAVILSRQNMITAITPD
jgi:EAL domain-containing protein (putative c-di-GMP-specific phosphodiesterase class I)